MTAPDPIARIAEAVLYEGYVLWPYRRSALKNRQRWTFGVVQPPAYAARSGEASAMRTECLVEGGADTVLDVAVRFLHLVRRQVWRARDGELEPVDALDVTGIRHLSWDEATERRVELPARRLGDLATAHSAPIAIATGGGEEALVDDGGRRVGAVVRTWEALAGRIDVVATPLGSDLFRVAVTIANLTPWQETSRAEAREHATRRAFCAAHTVLHVAGGAFVSLMDPPAEWRAAAAACRNVGTWPVLVGDAGTRDTMLSSPITLYDHPEIAPESPGDLFDAGEIDQLLVLNVLALTDDERAEMAATDPRTREILARCQALSSSDFMRLHGAIRGLRGGR